MMKKRSIAAMLALVLMLSLGFTSLASYSQEEKTADALNELGLFMGTDKGYELEKKLTRAEGMALLVRMIGQERVAKEWTLDIPFKDVPLWAIGYVGYAQAYGITNGTSATTFSPNTELSDYMFLTLVLRALGYTDQGAYATFTWNDPYAQAKKVGLIDKAQADGSFTRGDAVEIFWKAMDASLVGRKLTLADSLIAQGIFTKADFEHAAEIRENGREENAGTPIVYPEDTNNTAQPDENNTSENELPWTNGGKQPEDYTLAEYEALSFDLQMAFQKSFASEDAFVNWLNQFVENDADNGGRNDSQWTGSKLPTKYTWAEFEALSGAEQMAFQNWFGSTSAFEAWMNKAQTEAGSTWTGSKLPTSYTWAEFEALSGAEQMAFQKWFGSSEAFVEWMQSVSE